MRVDTPTLPSMLLRGLQYLIAWIDSSMVQKSVDYFIFILRFRYYQGKLSFWKGVYGHFETPRGGSWCKEKVLLIFNHFVLF